ncbi:MAG: hypothetical protein ACK4WC_05770 [Rubrimonas sp.]
MGRDLLICAGAAAAAALSYVAVNGAEEGLFQHGEVFAAAADGLILTACAMTLAMLWRAGAETDATLGRAVRRALPLVLLALAAAAAQAGFGLHLRLFGLMLAGDDWGY